MRNLSFYLLCKNCIFTINWLGFIQICLNLGCKIASIRFRMYHLWYLLWSLAMQIWAGVNSVCLPTDLKDCCCLVAFFVLGSPLTEQGRGDQYHGYYVWAHRQTPSSLLALLSIPFRQRTRWKQEMLKWSDEPRNKSARAPQYLLSHGEKVQRIATPEEASVGWYPLRTWMITLGFDINNCWNNSD